MFAEAANDPSKAAYKSFNRRPSRLAVPSSSPPVFIPDGRARARFFPLTINLSPRQKRFVTGNRISRERNAFRAAESETRPKARGALMSRESLTPMTMLAMNKSRSRGVFSSLMPTSPMDRNIDPARSVPHRFELPLRRKTD